MSSTAPTTPDNGPRRMAMNRSFTVPSKLVTTSRNAPKAEIGAAEGIETLYVHPRASIIKFTTSGPPSRVGTVSSAQSPGRPGSGALAWASPTERTMAAGPMEIYRVPGSVSFLHSGALLHAVMPRSQCWCVDGVSKFAFRVLPDTYYRIELPGETPEDLEKVEELKVTLAKVLFYEKTPCPFARTFTVDLPEQVEERKGRRRSHGPAKKWKLEKAYSWKPEDGVWPRRRGSGSRSRATSSSGDENTRAGGQRSSDDEASDASELADEIKDLGISTPTRPSTPSATRSVTAPANLPQRRPSASRTYADADMDGSVDGRQNVATPQRLDAARLRTFQPIPTDMPPSPPDSSAGMDTAETRSRTITTVEDSGQKEDSTVLNVDGLEPVVESDEVIRDLPNGKASQNLETYMLMDHTQQDRRVDSALDQTHSSLQTDQRDSMPPESTPTQVAEPNLTTRSNRQEASQPSSEDPFAAIQARILARRSIGGTTSFHPSRTSPTRSTSTSASSTSSTLTSRRSDPPHHRNQQAFASALVRKACAAFLGPPAHLVAIMLRIAARFASGAFGSTFYVESPAGSRRVPGSFDLGSIDVEDDYEEGLEDWEEDDFGVPLRSPVRLRVRDGRGWEID